LIWAPCEKSFRRRAAVEVALNYPFIAHSTMTIPINYHRESDHPEDVPEVTIVDLTVDEITAV
jgi:hypothetical protein